MSDTWSEIKTFLKREGIPFTVTYPKAKPDPWYGKYYDVHFPVEVRDTLMSYKEKGYFNAMRGTITFWIGDEIVS